MFTMTKLRCVNLIFTITFLSNGCTGFYVSSIIAPIQDSETHYVSNDGIKTYYHVIGDSIMSDSLFNGQIVTTLHGTDVNVTIDTSGVYINNAKVTVTDIIASNGVVHVIDAVLLLNTSAVVENEILSKGSYLYTVNILGKVISRDTRNQIVFDIYSNGEIQKRYTR